MVAPAQTYASLAAPPYRRPVLLVQADPFNRSRLQTTLAVVLTSNLRLVEAPRKCSRPAPLRPAGGERRAA
jgi:mRNA-degrading endonuclease toxin of MazEF toxin-antitoxin module